MMVQVRLFAIAATQAGTSSLSVDLSPPATVADLRASLVAKCPALASIMPHLMFAINADYAAEHSQIAPGDEVACIPPVSGG